MVAAPEVRAADAAAKERVAREEPYAALAVGGDEAAAARRVPGGVEDPELERPGPNHRPVDEFSVHVRALRDGGSDEGGLHGEQLVEEAVALVNARACAGGSLQLGGRSDVIDVGVGVHDRVDLDAQAVESRADDVEVTAGVDDEGTLGDEVGHDRAAAPERADREGFDVHAGWTSTVDKGGRSV